MSFLLRERVFNLFFFLETIVDVENSEHFKSHVASSQKERKKKKSKISVL